MNENEWPVARLLDLRKAYPRVNKPALWKLLERYGLNGHCLNVITDLHESKEYKVRANDGMSETWMPARGVLYLPHPLQCVPPGSDEASGGG